MPRYDKGPGTHKYLKPNKQDSATTRRSLWRGGNFALLQAKLTDLYSAQTKLFDELSDLHIQADLCRASTDGDITLERAKAEVRARAEHGKIKEEIKRSEARLRIIDQEVAETQKEIETASHSDVRAPALPWQHAAEEIVGVYELASSEHSPVYALLDRSGETKTTAVRPVLIKTKDAMRDAANTEAERREPERKKRLAALDRYLKTPKGRKEQRSKQAKAAAEKQAQQKRESDKTLTPEGRMLKLTFSEFDEQMRTQGFNVDPRQLRRFLSDILKVHLVSEQGKCR